MTTIVAVETEEGVVYASDSRIGGGTMNDGWIAKVFKNGPYVIGVAGYLRVSQLMQHAALPQMPKKTWRKKAMPIDTWVTRVLAPTFASISESHPGRNGSTSLVTIQGRVYEIDSDGAWTRNEKGIYAIGSGSQFALGALAAGATAEEAVKIAARYDNHTNSDVSTVMVKA